MKTYADFTDAELIVLLKERDHIAFTEIYNRYSVLMFYKVNQMLRDEEVSKDLVQPGLKKASLRWIQRL